MLPITGKILLLFAGDGSLDTPEKYCMLFDGLVMQHTHEMHCMLVDSALAEKVVTSRHWGVWCQGGWGVGGVTDRKKYCCLSF